jgi:hypothetical protein
MADRKQGPIREAFGVLVLLVFAAVLFIALLIFGMRIIFHFYPYGS